jgi:hypothetical protein
MLSKLLLTLALVALPVAAADNVQTGNWEDGSAIAWACQSKQFNKVVFAFKTKEGEVYQGVLTCGDTI